MKKKTYIQPQMTVVKMEEQQLICYSGGFGVRAVEDYEEEDY